jgi:RimJ/RimL family protein N-acetyltransferase
MHVRPLEPSDAEAYRRLMLEGYELAADAFTTTAQERAAEPPTWWIQRIGSAQGPGLAFGAFHAGQLVGSVAIEFSEKEKTRHKALVVGMYVRPQARRTGAGSALVQALLAHAKARSQVNTVTLTVTDGNTAAIALYESFGFVRFGLEPMAIFTGTEYKAKVHMGLGLR